MGSTDLYVLAAHDKASQIYEMLYNAGIYVRKFDYNKNWLRFGLPSTQAEFNHLTATLLGE